MKQLATFFIFAALVLLFAQMFGHHEESLTQEQQQARQEAHEMLPHLHPHIDVDEKEIAKRVVEGAARR
jgi:hypothetical protein